MAKTLEYRSLTGPEKAAIMMLAIGEENAVKLFKYMEDSEIRTVSYTMANLGNIPAQLVDALFVEFVELLSSTGSLTGSYDNTAKLLQRAIPADRVSAIMEDIQGPAGRTMWDKLANVSEVVLANYLKNESAQTISVVLSKIRPDHAAKILVTLPELLGAEVVQRMLGMETVQNEILNEVENTLRNEFVNNLQKGTRHDSHEIMADIFNKMESKHEDRFFEMLEQRDQETAEHIRSLMFTFEDLRNLDPQSAQMLIREIDANQLALALKGASEELKNVFFSNMSNRASKILQDDIDNMGAVRVRAVDDAQSQIITQAKQLAERGEIYLSSGGEGDQLVN
ncbi:MAG: flagellar motor switch protein FliG [Pseudomonadota bacterium]